ncbi:YdaS family helix-turn-helix protein [Stenotrophomonas sp.]|uniref:transcriptional regulator n=1 Tax=Stenotrophomonas sp. TaxID=69392 RepID=UPI0028979439|nr:YdaS family helix-turn-helix protein [Stenotrophomonas sp.]
MPALDKAVEAAGSQLALAQLLGIKPPSISGWYERRRVPAERCIAIETVTGVSRHELRPDVFGKPVTPEQASANSTQLHALVDSRMSKRALRARLGLSSDAHLAKVLKLPVDEVEAWPEEQGVPAMPQVLQLLGVQAEESAAAAAPLDPDADRIVNVEAA